MSTLAAATFLWACGTSGLCLDLANQDIHWPTIETTARTLESTATMFPVLLDCQTSKVYFLTQGLSGELGEEKFPRGTIFAQFCERAFGEST